MKKLLPILVLTALCSCAGTRTNGTETMVHTTSFNLLGLRIPFDDHEKAWSMIPEGADVHTAVSTPGDWTSIVGALTRILGFSGTQISYSTRQ